MASGRALTDNDRTPWLERVAAAATRELQSTSRVVVACSALKVKYRTMLRERICSREAVDVRFVLLAVGAAELAERLEARARAQTHFMSPTLLASQLATLEVAADDLVVHAADGVESTAARVISALDLG